MVQRRNKAALETLQEFVSRIERGLVPSVQRVEAIQKFVESLSEESDPTGQSFIKSSLVDRSGRWKDDAASMKFATADLLSSHPLELPLEHQTPMARFLCGIQKKRGSPYLEFEFKTSGDQAAQALLTVSQPDDYKFSKVRALLPKLGKIKRAQMLLRTGQSAGELCEDLFSRSLDVEIYMQNPKMQFVSARARKLIRSFCSSVEHRWHQVGKGSLRVYTSIAIASVRAVRIESSCVAVGWLPYTQPLPVKSQARSNGDAIDISVDTTSLPYVLAESGHPQFDSLNIFFDHCLSIARATAPNPVVRCGDPRHEL
jgi:hypothetical protein